MRIELRGTKPKVWRRVLVPKTITLLKLHLVSSRKEGTTVYYRLRNYHLVRAFHELVQALETHYQSNGSPSERSGAGQG